MFKPCFVFKFILFYTISVVFSDGPNLRILAPQFICPKDEDTPVDKPDKTVITLQTDAGSDLDIKLTVRWVHLESPSQRKTVMIWKAVRDLERQLNKPQPEENIYMIKNEELLRGIIYRFNVTAIGKHNPNFNSTKQFQLDNSQGDQKLEMVEGRGDLFSIIMIGGQIAVADLEFIMEAQVTTCSPTQDYHFLWTVRSTQTKDTVEVSHVKGTRLEIQAYSLKAGLVYDVNCQVIKESNGAFITQTGLSFSVIHRGLKVYLSVDYIVVSVNTPFQIDSFVINHDCNEETIKYYWSCEVDEKLCNSNLTQNLTSSHLIFPGGVPTPQKYQISLSVEVCNLTAKTNMTIIMGVDKILPIIQNTATNRILNEGTALFLSANVSNVAPTCNLTWYFASKDHLNELQKNNATCAECQHGTKLSETITVFSLQETFLTELIDFTNDTDWRQVTAETVASDGRARFVATCGCSVTFECETKGTAIADVNFILNESPKIGNVMITPEFGEGLITLFRISTLAVVDPDIPLRYSFYCSVGGNYTILLASFIEHLAVETILPYINPSGTKVWIEVCDALGACARTHPKIVKINVSDLNPLDWMMESVRGHIRRCEIMLLRKMVVTVIATYKNAGDIKSLSDFTSLFLNTIADRNKEECVISHHEDIINILYFLQNFDIDTKATIDKIKNN